MYKVGVLIMGKPNSSQSGKVKQIVLEVQAKTKLKNILEYLEELNKLGSSQVYFSLQKKGRPVSQESSISQVLKQVRPQNGVIKLYLYEAMQQISQQRIQLKHSRHELNNRSKVSPQKSKSNMKQSNIDEQKKRCCCF